MQTRLLFMLATLISTGSCGPTQEPPPEPDGGSPEDLPPCSETAALYEVDASDRLVPLEDGALLGVTLGFQGFLFARVMFRSPHELRADAAMSSRVTVEGLPDQSQMTSHVPSAPSPDGRAFDTGPILIFFNDAVLAELVAKPATVRLTAATQTCRITVQLAVTLRDGGRQDTDGGISSAADR